ncbi:hypothetical protein F441_18950 [Phytophthora nicotianae CJ01A1]|uniref:Uncharacterized protein n=2 Tax=Phytophthora nicotianae TaxID=4792 RepID=W2K823_PHYNI|nr:hypothetical protein L917_18290 [Phytophthora nicotianae]ETM34563.1 hypothetical protein L914_18376 [Phytophthora nicotianae]ETP04254.1 hypothetical protein F441_18950 [Phytophthora nicotianae CJ01A1]
MCSFVGDVSVTTARVGYQDALTNTIGSTQYVTILCQKHSALRRCGGNGNTMEMQAGRFYNIRWQFSVSKARQAANTIHKAMEVLKTSPLHSNLPSNTVLLLVPIIIKEMDLVAAREVVWSETCHNVREFIQGCEHLATYCTCKPVNHCYALNVAY